MTLDAGNIPGGLNYKNMGGIDPLSQAGAPTSGP